MQLFTLVTLSIIAFGFTKPVGLDSYEIYLNDKLILKQFVNQPLSLRQLRLDKANDNDRLRIYYRHCNVPETGTGRSIAVKDDRGNVLKKWEFANATGSKTDMVISVKELLWLEKNNAGHDLRLHYTARELPKGEMLAAIHLE